MKCFLMVFFFFPVILKAQVFKIKENYIGVVFFKGDQHGEFSDVALSYPDTFNIDLSYNHIKHFVKLGRNGADSVIEYSIIRVLDSGIYNNNTLFYNFYCKDFDWNDHFVSLVDRDNNIIVIEKGDVVDGYTGYYIYSQLRIPSFTDELQEDLFVIPHRIDSINIEGFYYPAPTILNLVKMANTSLQTWEQEIKSFQFSDKGIENGGVYFGSGKDLSNLNLYTTTKFPGNEIQILWVTLNNKLPFMIMDELVDKLNPYLFETNSISNGDSPSDIYKFKFYNSYYKAIISRKNNMEIVVLNKLSQ